MEIFYHVIGEGSNKLWGLTSRERLHGTLKALGTPTYCEDLSNLPSGCNLLIFNNNFLFDRSAIRNLIQHKNSIILDSEKTSPAAAYVQADLAKVATETLKVEHVNLVPEPLELLDTDSNSLEFEDNLRKLDKPLILKITSDNNIYLENYLYEKSYKGITDLVTKWLWPIPARRVVRYCVKMKIKPNQVTIFGWMLTIITGIFFYFGQFWFGLLTAWTMTFLDTVDGKLARVTLNSSRLGHLLDHGLDIIHPPFWYWLWALGLSGFAVGDYIIPLNQLVLIIFIAYIAGRLLEGLFQLLFNRMSMFCWRPIDSINRLITARRNPCLIILTISMFFNRPDIGLVGVVVWSVFSSIFLFARLIVACFKRVTTGQLQPWLKEVDLNKTNHSLLVRVFYGRDIFYFNR